MFFRGFSRHSSSWVSLLRSSSLACVTSVGVTSSVYSFLCNWNDEEIGFGFPRFNGIIQGVITTSSERIFKSAPSSPNKKKDDDELFEGQCLKRQMHKPALPYPAWDYNWDGRMTPGTTLEAFRNGTQTIASLEPDQESSEEGNNLDSKPKRGRRKKKSRHIILVRHGQYEEKAEEKDRILTPLGRYQARATGRRLAQLSQGAKHFYPDTFNGPCHIKAIHVSDMIRAKETAALIAEQVQYYTPKNKALLQPPDPLLNEALPAPMVPIRPDIPGVTEEIDANQERIEKAFRKYFYRDNGIMDDLDDETSNNELDEFEIIVCHGNVIRYFLCRALQLPPEAWLRFSTFNCSITYLVIRPEGMVVARSVGDTGHLNYEQLTFSGYPGLKW
jgi:serine/threonine-protein phosphatase PGAM5